MSSFGKKIPAEESLSRYKAVDAQTSGKAVGDEVGQAKNSDQALKLVERFEVRAPRYHISDLILPEAVRQEIITLKSRINNHALIYHEWGFQKIDPIGVSVAVNYYGPPGTGKTMCAEALAADMGQPILEVNYAEIESKYVGETPKNIVAAFAEAKKSRALLFFDEADSILGRRLTNVTQSADHGVNVSRSVMLKQLDSFDGIVVFATNLAKNFDGAFVRRILQHVYIPLPDEQGRFALWNRMVGTRVPGRDLIDFDSLAKASAGFSGGLIKNAVLLAMCEAASREKGQQILQQNDLIRALQAVRRASQEVGFGQTVWTELNDPMAPTSNTRP
jgi:ATP-dependent 26S proteasome regulatory subunit